MKEEICLERKLIINGKNCIFIGENIKLINNQDYRLFIDYNYVKIDLIMSNEEFNYIDNIMKMAFPYSLLNRDQVVDDIRNYLLIKRN